MVIMVLRVTHRPKIPHIIPTNHEVGEAYHGWALMAFRRALHPVWSDEPNLTSIKLSTSAQHTSTLVAVMTSMHSASSFGGGPCEQNNIIIFATSYLCFFIC